MFKFRYAQSWLPTESPEDEFPNTTNLHEHTKNLMPRKFEGLEAAVLLFAGGYGVLLTLFLLQAALLPMLSHLAIFALGVFRIRKPARNKSQWTFDAIFSLIMLAVLFADSRTGGGSGPYLYLVLLLAMTFPLLMESTSAMVFAALLLLIYFALGRGDAWNVPPALFVLRGVLVAGMCLLSARFGAVLRRSEGTVEQLRRDISSGAYNPHGLLRYGEPALRQSRRQGKPFSLVYLHMPSDWAQQILVVKGYVSSRPREMRQLRAQALTEIAHKLTLALPSECLVGRDTRGDWVLLIPGKCSKEAIQILEHKFGRPLQINFGAVSDEMFVSMMPCVVQAQAGEALLDLYTRAVDILSRGVKSGAV